MIKTKTVAVQIAMSLLLNVFVDQEQGHRAVYRQHGPQEWGESGHGAVSRNGRQPGQYKNQSIKTYIES